MKAMGLAASLLAATVNSHAESTLLFAGDVMLDDGPGESIAHGGDPLAPFAAILGDADYRIGNLECPVALGGEERAFKPVTFRAHPRVLSRVKGRFDAVSVANNHSADYGQAAFMETLAHLNDAGIAAFGGGPNLQVAHQAHWFTLEGLRIAVLGYDEFKPRAFEAGPDWPGVAWSEDTHVLADIRAARAAGADLVIPFMHWGWEYEPAPNARQVALAHLMIDAGADAVIGGHPHVTQGADVYRGKPIVWSLGNFVFDGFDTPETTTGWLARLTVDAKGIAALDTVQARIDANGTPTPALSARTPCWRRGDDAMRECRAGRE